jgi:hypothetical protein
MAAHQRSALTRRTACLAAAQSEAAARRTGFMHRASHRTGTLLLAWVPCGAWREAQTPCAHLAANGTPWDEPIDASPEAMAPRMPQRAHAVLQERIQPALAHTPASASGCAEVVGAACPHGARADRTGGALPDSRNDPVPGSGGRAAQAGATRQAVWDSQGRRLAHGALTAWNMPAQTSGATGVAWAHKGL